MTDTILEIHDSTLAGEDEAPEAEAPEDFEEPAPEDTTEEVTDA